MEKLLIIYSPEKVIAVSPYSEGTAVVTPHSYMIETRANALVMLEALNVDTQKLKDFEMPEM